VQSKQAGPAFLSSGLTSRISRKYPDFQNKYQQFIIAISAVNSSLNFVF
jgi:hypothetical protein